MLTRPTGVLRHRVELAPRGEHLQQRVVELRVHRRLGDGGDVVLKLEEDLIQKLFSSRKPEIS